MVVMEKYPVAQKTWFPLSSLVQEYSEHLWIDLIDTGSFHGMESDAQTLTSLDQSKLQGRPLHF